MFPASPGRRYFFSAHAEEVHLLLVSAYAGLCDDVDFSPQTTDGWKAYRMQRQRNVVPLWAQHGTMREGTTAMFPEL
jgi:hypothetical protein